MTPTPLAVLRGRVPDMFKSLIDQAYALGFCDGAEREKPLLPDNDPAWKTVKPW